MTLSPISGDHSALRLRPSGPDLHTDTEQQHPACGSRSALRLRPSGPDLHVDAQSNDTPPDTETAQPRGGTTAATSSDLYACGQADRISTSVSSIATAPETETAQLRGGTAAATA